MGAQSRIGRGNPLLNAFHRDRIFESENYAREKITTSLYKYIFFILFFDAPPLTDGMINGLDFSISPRPEEVDIAVHVGLPEID
jgi:hypothetical protein